MSELLSQAEIERYAGRRVAEHEALQRVIEQDADNPEAAHRLGLLAYERGALREAEDWLRRAMRRAPERRSLHDHLGNTLKGLERYAEAETCYLRALALDPEYAEATHHLGSLRLVQGRIGEAAALQREAIAKKPGFDQAWYALGNTLRRQGKHDEAIDAYRSCVALRPQFAAAWNNLGTALKDRGRREESVEAYRRALTADPALAEASVNLGNALLLVDKHAEAVDYFRRALQTKPKDADARLGLSKALRRIGRSAEAKDVLEAAVVAAPSRGDVWAGLANSLRELGRLDEAVEAAKRGTTASVSPHIAFNALGMAYNEQLKHELAVEAYFTAVRGDAKRPDFQTNLGNALAQARRPKEAVTAYTAAFKLDPSDLRSLGLLLHHRRSLCDWKDIESEEARLVSGIANGGGPVEPFALACTESDPMVQCRNARAWMKRYYPTRGQRPPMPADAASRSKLRIGYLSSDLREHPVGRLVVEVLERHDRANVEVFGLDTWPKVEGGLAVRCKAAVDRMENVSALSHRATAQRVQELGIDILVDLNGHTRGARPGILGEGAAPIQVNWLGFPGPLGDLADWALVDEVVVPMSEEASFIEKLAWLPFSYQPTDTLRKVADKPTRAACGLPEQGPVLATFNALHKLTPAAFAGWMRLLVAVPDAVLWVLEGLPEARESLRAEAQRAGVASERIRFAPKLPQAEHLARLAHVDLVLDNLPYGAHTTASDALWMGVPVLTQRGRAFPGRVAASLLLALGAKELVADTAAEYEAIALRYLRDPAFRDPVRAKVASARTSGALFDPKRFAGDLEAAYRKIWDIRASGQPPRSFRVR